jgi:hypothetical protein
MSKRVIPNAKYPIFELDYLKRAFENLQTIYWTTNSGV